jgi:two-component system nitrate/nitrite sensor histidine kinase NarX
MAKPAGTNNWSQPALTFLYELSSTINAADNSLKPCAEPLKLITQKLGGSAAIIRLVSEEGWMDLYASRGLSKDQISDLQHTPIERSLFVHERLSIKEIRRGPASALINDKASEIISIPVRHHGHTLGVLNVFVPADQFHLDDETALMLLAVGQHIGLAIERQRLENVAKQKLIQEERNMIANELHDSLAQTLASLRFQVRILDQTLQPTSDYMAIMSLEQVEHGLDEAYTDLRELIAHCRVPIEQQGLIPSIERVVSKFREETGIHILLQCECQDPGVPANMEMNIYRIVQEALTNIKKHANAHIVRVLLSCNSSGQFRVLVENDGKGFDKKLIESKEGQHLGLTIMQERARHLGGQLRIESELEEGTRIELKFRYLREQAE